MMSPLRDALPLEAARLHLVDDIDETPGLVVDDDEFEMLAAELGRLDNRMQALEQRLGRLSRAIAAALRDADREPALASAVA